MGMEVSYTPAFIQQLKKLPLALQDDAMVRIKLFKDRRNHHFLRVHKLRGKLEGRFSFSIDFRFRIVFCYLTKEEAVLLAVGIHDVYNISRKTLIRAQNKKTS